MFSRIKTVPFLFALLTVLIAAPAFAGGATIVGSWEATSTVDGSTDSAPLLATFNIDRTLISTGPSTGNSVAHGAWRRTGFRTFSSTIVFFIFDSSGNASLKVTTNDEYEVSHDGQSYTSAFEANITALDGTPVSQISGTSSGTRITVQ